MPEAELIAMSRRPSRNLLGLALAGALATVPMTLLMKRLHEQLPKREQYPLPPERITAELTRRIGVQSQPDKKGWEIKTYAGHYLYGSAAAMAYSIFAKRLPLGPVFNGIIFGLAVWTASYLGLLPAAGLHPSAAREPARRNLLMIAAHVVWGATIGAVVKASMSSPTRSSGITREVKEFMRREHA